MYHRNPTSTRPWSRLQPSPAIFAGSGGWPNSTPAGHVVHLHRSLGFTNLGLHVNVTHPPTIPRGSQKRNKASELFHALYGRAGRAEDPHPPHHRTAGLPFVVLLLQLRPPASVSPPRTAAGRARRTRVPPVVPEPSVRSGV
jgi:hypothetical protein